ncbi:GNAT family N-acetyltransferase [Luteolibacter ambystomatis]|uniref:GNAT family N-acetyltransferase n=1 Tax=Luteolibacter ambystomatis TaxID=2824561 RepID=A0A975J043_9BACT|nr:GNAT family N-acetyltransferase [Luteolibacter ambystomatis]QUE51560.1 GNAT family N-acetyltransferase [Luteolibacter ambystomatis]
MSDLSDFDRQPTLIGPTVSLKPLQPEDFEALFTVASDPLIWEQHPDSSRRERAGFEKWFAAALSSGGAFTIRDLVSGNVIGSSRYYDWDPEKREIAIGYTFLARSHWGGVTNREMKRLMLDHAFQSGLKVWFHIWKDNLRSRRAVEKIGAILSHTGHKEVAGVPHDYTFYFITGNPG